MSNTQMKYDAVIIGARAAGASTAMLLAKSGARALLVDRVAEIGDTLSTHALMRPGVALLEKWGLAEKLVHAGTPMVSATEFAYGNERIHVPIKNSGNVGGLLAPRRSLLDGMLVEAAIDAGAELRLSTAFEGCLFGSRGQVAGARLRNRDGTEYSVVADLVVGADGRTSRVADSVGASIVRQTEKGSATLYGYYPGIPNEGYRWLFTKGCQSGLIPTNDGLHCVFASCRPEEFRARFGSDVEKALADAIHSTHPDLAEQMRRQGPVGRLTRFGGSNGFVRQCVGDGWALIGDAGYFKDPATAHGITDAFLDAHRFAETVLSGECFSLYSARRERHAVAFMEISHKIAAQRWTLSELKVLHAEINALMKIEAIEVAGAGPFEMAA